MLVRKMVRVRVISLCDKPSSLVQTLSQVFLDVDTTPGIDLRNVSASLMLQSNLITDHAAWTISNGRSTDEEIPSGGAVGLAEAVRLALEADEGPILLFEEDCVITDIQRLKQYVTLLLRHETEFDMAVFGILKQYKDTRRDAPPNFLNENWSSVHGRFWLLHCCLYTTQGRKKVSQALRHSPLHIQIDSFFGDMAQRGELRILGLSHEASPAIQGNHPSSIQKGFVSLTSPQPPSTTDPVKHPSTLAWGMITVVALAVIALVSLGCHKTFRSLVVINNAK